VFPGTVLKALVAFALVVGIHASPAMAAGECTNAQLRATLKSAPTDPRRASQLQKFLRADCRAAPRASGWRPGYRGRMPSQNAEVNPIETQDLSHDGDTISAVLEAVGSVSV
jgi:hypothetical protein